MSFTIDRYAEVYLCFKLCLLERWVQETTYDLGFVDNSITNQFDRSLQLISVIKCFDIYVETSEGTFGGSNLRGPNIQPIATTLIYYTGRTTERSKEIALMRIPT
jgi:hypothetical protein